ncbi:MAG TPA: radical SAM protein [Armatimonadota bacterium]|nr:radical SAM protein [Armatimonadota bacterium]
MPRYRRLARQYLGKYASVLLVKALPRLEASNKLQPGLVLLANLARAIPIDEFHRLQLEKVREAFRNNHPAVKLVRRTILRTHPKCLSTIFRNLWLPWFINDDIRADFRDREGFDPPTLAVISPLKECNLKCTGCYASAVAPNKAERLDFNTLDRIVTELQSFGTNFIVFSGGEPTHPLIWNDIKAICTKHNDLAFMMYTNGTLIDDAKVRDLREIGNMLPSISIEGWQAETDGRRGSGVYARVMDAMDRLRGAGIPFGYSLTYTSSNFKVATDPAFVDHLMDKGCIFGWYFMYVPVGKDPDLSLVVTPEQRDKIRQFTWDMFREKGLFIADFWNSGPICQGCIAGGRYLHVNNKGDIEPCVFFKFSDHNVRDSRLIDALRSRFFSEIRKAQGSHKNPLMPCQFMDHPEDGRHAVEVSGVRASEEGGEAIFSERIFPYLESLSNEYRHRYADHAWIESGDYASLDWAYGEPRWLAPGPGPSRHLGREPAAAEPELHQRFEHQT